jgi:hypothetical protein
MRVTWQSAALFGFVLSYATTPSSSIGAQVRQRASGPHAQSTAVADIKAVTEAGKQVGNEYQNSYFHVRVPIPQPNTWVKVNSLVSNNRAILLEAVNEAESREQRHVFSIVAHSTNIPGLTSLEQFVRSARHSLEREGMATTRSETPVKIGGREFIECELKSTDPNKTYSKAIIITFIKDYAFGFWIEAPDEKSLKKLSDLDGKVTFE